MSGLTRLVSRTLRHVRRRKQRHRLLNVKHDENGLGFVTSNVCVCVFTAHFERLKFGSKRLKVAVHLLSHKIRVQRRYCMFLHIDNHKPLPISNQILLQLLVLQWDTLLVAQLVETLRHKPEGRGFDSR